MTIPGIGSRSNLRRNGESCSGGHYSLPSAGSNRPSVSSVGLSSGGDLSHIVPSAGSDGPFVGGDSSHALSSIGRDGASVTCCSPSPSCVLTFRLLNVSPHSCQPMSPDMPRALPIHLEVRCPEFTTTTSNGQELCKKRHRSITRQRSPARTLRLMAHYIEK